MTKSLADVSSVEPLLTDTCLQLTAGASQQRLHFLCPDERSFIPFSDFNLSTKATYSQRQQLLKLVPAAKIASPLQPVNKRQRMLCKQTHIYFFFISKGQETCSTLRGVGLFFYVVSILLIKFYSMKYLYATIIISI